MHPDTALKIRESFEDAYSKGQGLFLSSDILLEAGCDPAKVMSHHASVEKMIRDLFFPPWWKFWRWFS